MNFLLSSLINSLTSSKWIDNLESTKVLVGCFFEYEAGKRRVYVNML